MQQTDCGSHSVCVREGGNSLANLLAYAARVERSGGLGHSFIAIPAKVYAHVCALAPGAGCCFGTQRVHVGRWYILRAQRGSHILTLKPKYIPYNYMDPLGK